MTDEHIEQSDPAAPPLKRGIRDAFQPGDMGAKSVLFLPEELDIYCNKITRESFIFHGKKIDYKTLHQMEYDHETYEVDVHLKDGRILDLGVKIQWLIRPYLSKSEEIQVVLTKDGEAIDGTFIPLTHRNKG